MIERLRRHIASRGILLPGDRIVVAYSGGADSTFLVAALCALDYDVVAAHLHHGMRAKADAEADLAAAWCESLGIPFVLGRADVPHIAQLYKIGLEEAGRQARYDFLERARLQTESRWVATGHTRSDNVETILFNLARGCGLKGVSGIPECRDAIVRPLLEFSREETRDYCSTAGLWFHDDPANDDVSFARTRIRHNVLPELSHIHPQVEANMARFAQIATLEDRYLDAASATAMQTVERTLNGPLGFLTRDVEAAFTVAELLRLPLALLNRGLGLVSGTFGRAFDFAQREAIVEALKAGRAGSISSEDGAVVASWDAERLHIQATDVAEPFRFRLQVPGSTDSDVFGWALQAQLGATHGQRAQRDALTIQIDPKLVNGSLYFRSMETGDAMAPAGFDGTRKLSDLISEAKLTQAARKRLPIVCDLVGPIWAPGVCYSNRVKCDVNALEALILSFGPLE